MRLRRACRVANLMLRSSPAYLLSAAARRTAEAPSILGTERRLGARPRAATILAVPDRATAVSAASAATDLGDHAVGGVFRSWMSRMQRLAHGAPSHARSGSTQLQTVPHACVGPSPLPMPSVSFVSRTGRHAWPAGHVPPHCG